MDVIFVAINMRYKLVAYITFFREFVQSHAAIRVPAIGVMAVFLAA
jgi:hypothetical protein